MTTPFRRSRIATAIGALALALGAGGASAAGFALQENSGSGLGNAYAGGAAAAEDAATLWSNVAGISKIKTNQVVAAINLIKPSMKFSNGASQAAIQQPLGGDGGDAGEIAYVPNLYLVVPINKQWTFGLGINAPYGLVDEYDNGWIGRYQALKSDIKTMNINPAVSWQVTDNVAIGAGANYQQIKATLTSNVNYSGFLAQALGVAVAKGQVPASAAAPFLATTQGLDANANINGDDSAWGWNVGILIDADKNNRFGLAWRSGIKYDVSGNVSVTPPPAPTLPASLAPIYVALSTAVNAQLPNGGVNASIELPGIANFSWFGRVSDRWDVMVDAQWTQWSKIQNLTFIGSNGLRCGKHARELQGRLARLGRGELPLRRTVDVPRRPRLGSVAGAGCRSHAAAAGLGPRLARGRRAIQDEEPRLEIGLRRGVHLGPERHDQQRGLQRPDGQTRRPGLRTDQRHVQQQRGHRFGTDDVLVLTAQ